ncbi:MAG: CBS domain-containing protein [Deltaproteobacteria bacterium]|nr:CBS domain-containing protein [Deltaproteobacteria bacterium]
MAKVKDIMKSPVRTIFSDEPIINAIKMMKELGFRRLPVLDRDNNLVGIVTDRDLRQATNSPVVFHDISYDEYLVNEIRVGACMSSMPITITPEADIVDAARIMENMKIGGVPVVDNTGRIVGMVTVSDLINYLIFILEQ